MINIVEAEPIKLSGLTSFRVTFNYNPAIVEAMKTIPAAIWHKKLLTWEIPCDCLTQALDTLTFYDEITLQLFQNESISETGRFQLPKKYNLAPLSEEERKAFKATPYAHQFEAIDFLLRQEKSLLLDGCGVGKSLEMILFAETLKKRGIIDHCLVITGIAGLRGNWEHEIAKFSTESVITIGKYITRTGTTRYHPMAKRAEQLKNQIEEFFVLLNVESLRDPKIIEAIKKSENTFGLIAFDEVHRCVTGDTIVDTDLGKLSIKFIVDNSISCRVKSLNVKTQKIEYNLIKGFHKNFPSEPLVELCIEEHDKTYKLQCTKSHKIFTKNRGYVKAIDLVESDEIVLDL